MITHELKTHPEPFQAIFNGKKRFELRSIHDRQFLEGDKLLLREWEPSTEQYTGVQLLVHVDYLLAGGMYGLPRHMCLMSITVEGVPIQHE